MFLASFLVLELLIIIPERQSSAQELGLPDNGEDRTQMHEQSVWDKVQEQCLMTALYVSLMLLFTFHVQVTDRGCGGTSSLSYVGPLILLLQRPMTVALTFLYNCFRNESEATWLEDLKMPAVSLFTYLSSVLVDMDCAWTVAANKSTAGFFVTVHVIDKWPPLPNIANGVTVDIRACNLFKLF